MERSRVKSRILILALADKQEKLRGNTRGVANRSSGLPSLKVFFRRSSGRAARGASRPGELIFVIYSASRAPFPFLSTLHPVSLIFLLTLFLTQNLSDGKVART